MWGVIDNKCVPRFALKHKYAGAIRTMLDKWFQRNGAALAKERRNHLTI